MASILGIGDGVFNTQLSALLAILFKHDMVLILMNKYAYIHSPVTCVRGILFCVIHMSNVERDTECYPYVHSCTGLVHSILQDYYIASVPICYILEVLTCYRLIIAKMLHLVLVHRKEHLHS